MRKAAGGDRHPGPFRRADRDAAKRSSPHYRLYLAALTTGMRQGELLGLRWRDVELTLGVASIQQVFYRLGDSKRDQRPTQQLFKAPKTERARRQVALPSVLVEGLRRLREEQRELRQLFGAKYAADLDLCSVSRTASRCTVTT